MLLKSLVDASRCIPFEYRLLHSYILPCEFCSFWKLEERLLDCYSHSYFPSAWWKNVILIFFFCSIVGAKYLCNKSRSMRDMQKKDRWVLHVACSTMSLVLEEKRQRGEAEKIGRISPNHWRNCLVPFAMKLLNKSLLHQLHTFTQKKKWRIARVVCMKMIQTISIRQIHEWDGYFWKDFLSHFPVQIAEKLSFSCMFWSSAKNSSLS